MVKTIRTGAHAYVKYGYEATYAGTATPDKKFGLQDTISNLSLTHNRIDLAQLGQVEYGTYAYGQQAASMSVGFTLSNPWIFRSILGPSSGTDPFVFGGSYAAPATAQTLQVEIGVGGSEQDVVRTLKGGVANSLGLTTSVGNTVQGNIDLSFGSEGVPRTTGALTAPAKPTAEFPYTFAHGELTINDVVISELQDVDITFAQNTNLLYQVGTNQAVDSYRQIFDITGRFRAAFVDKTFLDHTLNQIAKGTGTTYAETIGGTIELKLAFVKDGDEEIIITGQGLAPTDHGISGLAPVEPIFEDISWRIKSAIVSAKDTASAEE